MGYCVKVTESEFSIEKENVAAVLEAGRNMRPEHFKQRCFRFVQVGELEDAENISDLFNIWGYEIEHEEGEGIEGISMNLEKIGDEELFFSVIAPFVNSGSYIQYAGEDGVIWRIAFKDGMSRCISPKIDWSGDDREEK